MKSFSPGALYWSCTPPSKVFTRHKRRARGNGIPSEQGQVLEDNLSMLFEESEIMNQEHRQMLVDMLPYRSGKW